jgi:integrase/recombinase XerC
MTWENAVEQFLSCLAGQGRAENTLLAYRLDLAGFARWYEKAAGQSPQPGGVGPFDVAEYRRWLLDAGRKPSTVNRALGALSWFFAWAVKNGLAPENPASGVRRVSEAPRPPRALGRREQLALLRAVQRRGKPRDIAFVTLLLHTGLRVSEACALTVDDIHIGERHGRAVVRQGKGEKYREVPLNVTVRKALAVWLAVRGTAPGYLFTSQRGERLTRRGAEHLVARYAREAGLEITPHVLRHTFCKNLVDAGESLDRVAWLAGHANLNTTARYTRPTQEDLEKAVDRLAWE